MKRTKLFLAAILMASTAVVSAADIENTFTVDLTNAEPDIFSGDFGNTFDASASGKSFLDIFNFSVAGISDFDAAVTSIRTVTKNVNTLDLNLTTFNLFAGNTLVASGASV